jgi:hypothetical protein
MSRRVDEMTRSYELVLSDARERHPELPPALFRWSRAQFDFYRFEMLLGAGAATSSIAALALGLMRDPTWLARASVRRRAKHELRSLLARAGLCEARAPQNPPREPFATANPDAPYHMSEGRWFDERRRYVSALKL